MSTTNQQLLELEYIYDAAPVGLVLVDRDLRYVRVNKRLAALNGISVDNHIGRRIDEVVPEKADVLLPLYLSVLESGEEISGLEITLPVKGGGQAAYISSYYPLCDSEGAVVGVWGVIQDVTAERVAERDFRESEARYRFLTDSLPQFVWTLTDAGIAEYCNPYMLQYLGCSLEQIQAGAWKAAVHPEDLPDALKTREAGFAKRQAFELEMRIRRASDGEYRWHLFRSRPFTHNRGQWMWLGTALDIDGRKRAEQAHSLLASIVESSSDAIVGLNLAGAITSWNPAAENLFGYRSREAIGRPISFLMPGKDDAEGIRVLARVLSGERIDRHETIRSHKDAGTLTVQETVTPIRDQAGRVCGAFETFRDVTEQRRVERELASAVEWLRLVQGAVKAGTWEVESKTGAMYWSPELLDLFGLPPGVAPTMDTFARIVHPEDLAYVSAGIRESSERRVPLCLQFRVTTEAGMRWVSAYGTVVGTEDAARIVGISIDSTAMRKAQEAVRQAARMDSVGRLAGGVAHDYNNLLAGILGGASLIAEMVPPDDAIRPMVDLVIRSGERAATLTKQLLAYSGKGSFIVRELDLSPSVEKALALTPDSIPSNVTLSLQPASNLPLIEADESQVRQLVLTLVVNAVEAIGESAGAIEVRTGVETLGREAILARFSEDLAPGAYVYLEVKDSGEGMAPEVKSRIFEPFFTTRFMGRGLGLSALQGIVHGHRGGIEVHSARGGGSCFRIFFPAAAVRKVESAAGGLVLVIDDEEAVRKVVQASLARAGYAVVTAPDGAKGIEIFEQRRSEISLVILDVTMPQISGAEVHEHLINAGAGVPVVVVSGYPGPEALQRIGADRIAAFLQKPFKMRELCVLVEKLIGPARLIEVS